MSRRLLKIAALAATIAPLSACGSSDATPQHFGDGGTTPEADVPVFCSEKNIVGSWEAVGTTSQIAIYTFNSDATFALGIYTAADAGSFDEEEVTGTFKVSKAAVLTTSPEKVTCTATVSGSIYACTLLKGELFLTDDTLSTTKWKRHSSDPGPGSVTLGCGTPFMPYPLMPIP